MEVPSRVLPGGLARFSPALGGKDLIQDPFGGRLLGVPDVLFIILEDVRDLGVAQIPMGNHLPGFAGGRVVFEDVQGGKADPDFATVRQDPVGALNPELLEAATKRACPCVGRRWLRDTPRGVVPGFSEPVEPLVLHGIFPPEVSLRSRGR